MLQSRPPTIYIPRRHSVFHGPLTVILAIWGIAYPGLLLLLASFGPIGAIVSVGAAVVLFVPWLLGLIILAILRHIA